MDMIFMNIPVITGATGIVIEGLNKNLQIIAGKHSVDSLKLPATLDITLNMESTAV